MAITIGDPRYNISIGLTDFSTRDNYSRTFSYVNTAIGGASSGYSPEDIYEFAEAVASLSSDDAGGIIVNTVNLNAQYQIKDV